MPRLTKAQRDENRILLLEKKKLLLQSKISILQQGLATIEKELKMLTNPSV